ncbi:hypothetical protein ACHAWU_010399 [Discostella pseudostelligera]|uniref:Protein kinase domain-containing protein n=1 Tax=Discostella pseudostelligera TaxID=259834 RepID=A0ABD3MN52_9STRA
MRALRRYASAAVIIQSVSISAFAPPLLGRSSNVNFPPLSAGPPIISNWRYESSKGTISGIVSNHPTIPDGDRITTSQVKNPGGVNENMIVETKSGSKYKLSNVAYGAIFPALEIRIAKEKEAVVAKNDAARLEAEIKSKAKAAQKPAQASNASRLASPSLISSSALRKLAKSKFSLTGTTVGADGKYLLAANPRQSSGRSAKIWTAYLSDPDMPGVPAGFDGGDASNVQQLTIKLSPDYERLQLENSNYNKVQSGLFSGRFVKKIEYIDSVPSNDRNLDGKVSALVIESGQCDLKALLSARKGMPLRGRALRDAAVSAGQCIQAVHSSNVVWTDLKTENFVLVNSDIFNKEVRDVDGSMGMPGVKGIDLESVVAKGGNPIDYTPEACPPEFAKALMGGYGEEFVLDYSYDMWSLGMMLYELSTGTAYFDKKSPSIVTKLLCADTFEVDVSKVPDDKLRDLIGKCLSVDPRKRPDITGFLLHPYFLTTGFGPISF